MTQQIKHYLPKTIKITLQIVVVYMVVICGYCLYITEDIARFEPKTINKELR